MPKKVKGSGFGGFIEEITLKLTSKLTHVSFLIYYGFTISSVMWY